jgi:uncharacterized protein (DUF1684 family)
MAPLLTACLEALLMTTSAGQAAPLAAPTYRASIETWQAERQGRLRAPDGWLTLAGLFWLEAGANRFGSAPGNAVRLPASAPAHAGILWVTGRDVRVELVAGGPVRLNGGAAAAGPLRTDAGPVPPDVLAMGAVTLQVIDRGGRLGARVKDADSATRRDFAGTGFFPIAPEFRVVATLLPRADATKIVVPDASGGKQALESRGSLAFTLLGHAQRLDPVLDGDDERDQLVVFRDATSGHETYGGGRFVRALRQPDGTFVLDFNRAYSPPCAFTPYATCPLPPPQNRLPFAVPAGEKVPTAPK